MATVELRFTALPAHVRTARLVAVSLARRAGVEDDVLDEVRLAVGEAATRAVGRHEASCPAEPVLVRLSDGDGRFVAQIVDRAAGPVGDDGQHLLPEAVGDLHLVVETAQELPPGVDLAVIGGLVDDVTVQDGPAGSVVTMVWPVAAPASATRSQRPGEAAADAPQPAQ